MQRRFSDPQCSIKLRRLKPALLSEEKELLVNAFLQFRENKILLSFEGLKDLIELIFPAFLLFGDVVYRSETIVQENPLFSFSFTVTAHGFTYGSRQTLECSRAFVITPSDTASHFARLPQVYREYDIHSAMRVSFVDESGLSTRTAARARAKALMSSMRRNYAIKLSSTENAEHVTILPVVSACGEVWNPVLILPGKYTKYRERSDPVRVGQKKAKDQPAISLRNLTQLIMILHAWIVHLSILGQLF